MTITKIEAVFNEKVETIWDIVTSLKVVSWRTDVSKIEVLEEQKKFVEYTNEGYPTNFVITKFEPWTLYAFTMDNDHMSGRWTGEFFPLTNQKTKIIFTEDVTPKKFYMKPFVKGYLKRQQQKYIDDLTTYLTSK